MSAQKWWCLTNILRDRGMGNRENSDEVAADAGGAGFFAKRLWNFCNVPRDDGMSHGDYVE
jgi:hypothetical protein